MIGAGRLFVEQLLHQGIVIVGNLLQHVEAGFALAALDGGRDGNDFGWCLVAVDKRALQREIDEAGGLAVGPDRDLPQHQGSDAGRLQHRDNFAHWCCEVVDLVEEYEMGGLLLREGLEDDLQGGYAAGVWFAHHDGEVDDGQGGKAFALKFNGTGKIEKSEIVTEIGRIGDVHLHAHDMGTGFGAGVADTRFGGGRAGPDDGAGPRQNGIQ